jgi:predicted neuraminidase
MMNKPIVRSDGAWLMPASIWNQPQNPVLPELADRRLSNVVLSEDDGATFRRIGGADVPNRFCDEHMLIELKDGRLWMLVRTRYGIGQSFSSDGGVNWSPGERSGIEGPNSRFFIRRLASGRLLLVYHAPGSGHPDPLLERDNPARHSLTAYLSDDEGGSWSNGLLLDGRTNVSYPDATCGRDGRIRIIYDFQRYDSRQILMADLMEEDILAGERRHPASRLAVGIREGAH